MTKQNHPKSKTNILSKLAIRFFRNFCSNDRFIQYFTRTLLLPALFLIILILFPSSISAQDDQKLVVRDWRGSYYFSEIAQSTKKRHSYDVVPSISYNITVEEKDGQLTASFSANGIQLFEAYECSIVIRKNKLDFHFERLGSAETQNFRKFRKGDLLFSLSKVQMNKKTMYLFQQGAYKIVHLIPAKQTAPVYFEKPKAGIQPEI